MWRESRRGPRDVVHLCMYVCMYLSTRLVAKQSDYGRKTKEEAMTNNSLYFQVSAHRRLDDRIALFGSVLRMDIQDPKLVGQTKQKKSQREASKYESLKIPFMRMCMSCGIRHPYSFPIFIHGKQGTRTTSYHDEKTEFCIMKRTCYQHNGLYRGR